MKTSKTLVLFPFLSLWIGRYERHGSAMHRAGLIYSGRARRGDAQQEKKVDSRQQRLSGPARLLDHTSGREMRRPLTVSCS